MSDHPRALPVPENVFAVGPDTETQELLRLWLVDGRAETMLWRAFDDPRGWGVLLAIVARNLAQVYGQTGAMDEREALKRIAAAIADALASPAEPATLKRAGEGA
jgi:hypothetical protein